MAQPTVTSSSVPTVPNGSIRIGALIDEVQGAWRSKGDISSKTKRRKGCRRMTRTASLSRRSGTDWKTSRWWIGQACVASHPETRIPFLNAHIPLYLYPFLNTTSKTRPFEYLRLTSLGVIVANLLELELNEIH
ncbi:cell differentiation protein RCD1 [Hordeum vulgare]|nr:cell differentiation protein RCD1 [Hordeum vulgare]